MQSNETLRPLSSVAPGRICLFGEHQDYLGLPVIAAAIPLCCRIHVTPTPSSNVLTLRFRQQQQQSTTNDPSSASTVSVREIHLDQLPPPPAAPMDFCLAAVYEVLNAGNEITNDNDGAEKGTWSFRCGAECVSETDLPLQAGCSSSSAFCVAWTQVLVRLCGHPEPLPPILLAKLAHRAEVLHFGAPGGNMDHVASAVGGIVRIGGGDDDDDEKRKGQALDRMWHVQRLNYPGEPMNDNIDKASSVATTASSSCWVLAYSGEPKDTMKHLSRCKQDRLDLLTKLGGSWDTPVGDSSTTTSSSFATTLPVIHLSDKERVLLDATLTNRNVEREAAKRWDTTSPSHLGGLLLQHHAALRDGLLLSTPRLEAMQKAAMAVETTDTSNDGAGAWGFKVVGSGGGGCGVAWCERKNAEQVKAAMLEAGATAAWIIDETHGGAYCVEKDCTEVEETKPSVCL